MNRSNKQKLEERTLTSSSCDGGEARADLLKIELRRAAARCFTGLSVVSDAWRALGDASGENARPDARSSVRRCSIDLRRSAWRCFIGLAADTNARRALPSSRLRASSPPALGVCGESRSPSPATSSGGLRCSIELRRTRARRALPSSRLRASSPPASGVCGESRSPSPAISSGGLRIELRRARARRCTGVHSSALDADARGAPGGGESRSAAIVASLFSAGTTLRSGLAPDARRAAASRATCRTASRIVKM